MVGADPFLAARNPQQILVDGPVPLPVETVAGEGLGEGLPMQLFGLSQGTVDVEDQRGGAADQLGDVTWPYGGRFCLHDLYVPPDERPSPAQAGETNCNIFCRTQKSLMSGGALRRERELRPARKMYAALYPWSRLQRAALRPPVRWPLLAYRRHGARSRAAGRSRRHRGACFLRRQSGTRDDRTHARRGCPARFDPARQRRRSRNRGLP